MWLKTLSLSKRICRVRTLSLDSAKFLATIKLVLLIPGPWYLLRATLPKLPIGSAAKLAGVKKVVVLLLTPAELTFIVRRLPLTNGAVWFGISGQA